MSEPAPRGLAVLPVRALVRGALREVGAEELVCPVDYVEAHLNLQFASFVWWRGKRAAPMERVPRGSDVLARNPRFRHHSRRGGAMGNLASVSTESSPSSPELIRAGF